MKLSYSFSYWMTESAMNRIQRICPTPPIGWLRLQWMRPSLGHTEVNFLQITLWHEALKKLCSSMRETSNKIMSLHEMKLLGKTTAQQKASVKLCLFILWICVPPTHEALEKGSIKLRKSIKKILRNCTIQWKSTIARIINLLKT